MDPSKLVIRVLSAEGLTMVENEDTLSLPSPYVITRLTSSGYMLLILRKYNIFMLRISHSFATQVEETGSCPVWEAEHDFTAKNKVNSYR